MDVYTKTLLSSYRYLERMANAIDKIVYSRAINSFYVSGNNLSFNSVEKVSEDILALTDRKVNLINLKLIIDQAFKKVSGKSASLLICVFIENKNCYESCDALQISLRTFFRRQNQAVESFSKALLQLGYNSNKFEKMLKNENWIKEIKSKFLKNEDSKYKDKSLNTKKDKCLKVASKKNNNCFESTKNLLHSQEKEVARKVNLQIQNNLHF